MSPLEVIGTILGLCNIAFLIRRSVWNYPFGLAMVSVYAFVFWDAKLYSDVILQMFFFVVQVWGWSVWLRRRGTDGLILVRRMTLRARAAAICFTAMGSAVLGAVMAAWTDAALPYWDAAITGISISAQILLSLCLIENWILWIAADALAIGVYSAKDLNLTAGLYAVFLIMSALGAVEWRRHEKAGSLKLRSA